MPHWRFAPFAGGGGSYNYSLSNRNKTTQTPSTLAPPSDPNEPQDKGESYWGGHAEAGFRLWMANRVQLIELMGRYTWTSLEGDDRSYWTACISTGTGF